MKFDSIPEKRILPGKAAEGRESPEVTARKYSMMIELLAGELDDVDVESRPTIVDFHGLPPNSTEEDFALWIKRELGVDLKSLQEGDRKESRHQFHLIDQAYKMGKDFLKETLKYSDKELDIGPRSIASQRDIFDLLGKTIQAGGVSGLSRAVLYCRIAKATVVAYEALKNDVKLVQDMTKDFESSVVSSYSDTKEPSPLVLMRESNGGKKHFFAAWDGRMKGTLDSRSKRLESFMLRFLTRPDSSAESASKDGIGVTITLARNQAAELLPVLCRWLVVSRGVNFLNIENKALLSEDQVEVIQEALSDLISPNNFNFENKKAEKTNSASVGNFQAVAITGKPSTSSKIGFEILLVDPDNKNNKGILDHNIYDVSKRVNARTRLDGGCPENVFEQLVEEASKKSGLSPKTIREALLEGSKAEGVEPSVAKVKKKNGNGSGFFYVAIPVYTRWRKFGWIDAAVSADVKKASK